MKRTRGSFASLLDGATVSLYSALTALCANLVVRVSILAGESEVVGAVFITSAFRIMPPWQNPEADVMNTAPTTSKDADPVVLIILTDVLQAVGIAFGKGNLHVLLACTSGANEDQASL